jgi:hypothetical protein
MSAYAIVLLAFAQVAATLTGFIGVVFVLGERSRRLNTDESSAIFHMLYSALSALFVSLFATVLLVYWAAEEHFAWRISNGLSGFIHLIGAGRLAIETSRQESAMQRAFVTTAIGLGTAGVSFMAAPGYLTREEALIFMLATLWTLGVTVIAFVSLLSTASLKSPRNREGE